MNCQVGFLEFSRLFIIVALAISVFQRFREISRKHLQQWPSDLVDNIYMTEPILVLGSTVYL